MRHRLNKTKDVRETKTQQMFMRQYGTESKTFVRQRGNKIKDHETRTQQYQRRSWDKDGTLEFTSVTVNWSGLSSKPLRLRLAYSRVFRLWGCSRAESEEQLSSLSDPKNLWPRFVVNTQQHSPSRFHLCCSQQGINIRVYEFRVQMW